MVYIQLFESNKNKMWQRLKCIHETFGTRESTFFIKKVISRIFFFQEMHLLEHLEAIEKYHFIVINYSDSPKAKRSFYEKQVPMRNAINF